MQRLLPTQRVTPPEPTLAKDWSLTQEQAQALRETYGSNDIVEKSRRRWLSLLYDTLLDPMIWFLLAASMLFAMLGKTSNAIILLLAIIPIGGMDAFLHWRTQASTQTLKSKLFIKAHVIRDNKEWLLPTNELVPGDLVVINAGEYIPADGIVIAAENVQVDESSLSGEAFPVAKKVLDPLPLDQANPLVAYQHWGFVGTRLLTGKMSLRVVYTGKETLYGNIITSVLETQHAITPLQKALSKLVGILIIVATIFCFLLAVVRLYQGFGLIDALLSAATLAVVALPDEFPMTFTFFLGVGVYRLARAHALVRRSVSVENIGRVTAICTDKTGTITTGIFRVAKLLPAKPLDTATLSWYAELASRRDSGDPLDQAIFAAATPHPKQLVERLQLYPFTEERKRETAVVNIAGNIFAVSKGAPETILELCELSADERKEWLKHLKAVAKQGLKVLACATRQVPEWHVNSQEPTQQYIFSGLLAFEDPPRAEVYAAIRYCKDSAIHVVMMTGDHPETAKKVAIDIGLGNGKPVVRTADEVEKLLEEAGPVSLRTVDVIARAIPSQKYAFVNALKSQGDIVAVTGDGVNDVPALQTADVGIAMGERGTQSAREAASIVLLDDNFGSITNAIREGKQLFKNLQLSFKYLMMVHTPYVISATLIPLLGYPLLYYPIHIVWIELLIHPTCMLVFQDLPDNKAEQQNTRPKEVAFFSRQDWWRIAILGIYTTLLVIAAYLLTLQYTGHATLARANAFLAVGLTHIALTIGLSKLQSITSRVIVGISVVMLLVLVQIPVISSYFAMQPPSLFTWDMLILASGVTAGLACWARR